MVEVREQRPSRQEAKTSLPSPRDGSDPYRPTCQRHRPRAASGDCRAGGQPARDDVPCRRSAKGIDQMVGLASREIEELAAGPRLQDLRIESVLATLQS